MTVVVEQLDRSTCDLAEPLLAVQLAEHGMGMERERLAAAIRGLVEHDRGALLLARSEQRAVGVAVLAYTWTLEHGGRVAWLDELYVVPDERARGIGTALLVEALRVASREGAVAVDLEVDVDHARAESLYARHGFRALPRRRFSRRL